MVAKKYIKNVGLLFTRLKDNIPKMLKANVIYKITCSTCHNVYIGQTSQWLKNRLAIHRSDLKKGLDRCALVGHVKSNQDHKIDLDNVEILTTDQNYERRIFLEMVNINKFDNTMNKKTDTQNLNVIYTYLLDYNNYSNAYDGPIDE